MSQLQCGREDLTEMKDFVAAEMARGRALYVKLEQRFEQCVASTDESIDRLEHQLWNTKFTQMYETFGDAPPWAAQQFA